MKKLVIIIVLLTIVFIFGCAPVQTTEQKPTEPEVKETVPEEVTTPQEVEEKKEIAADVKELLSKAKQKVQSISYKYKGSETSDLYPFYVRGDRIRYILSPPVKSLDVDEEAYESIYINKEERTAEAYCVERQCKVKGKKADLNYDEVYIMTPFDWLNQIGYAEKLGEELIEKRQTWKLNTDNAGIVWVDMFFGVPLQVEFNGNKYKFIQMTFNDVKDSDVIPS